jgi:hypothetical protein
MELERKKEPVDGLHLRQARMRGLRPLIRVGLDQAERGETVSGADVFRRLENKIKARRSTPGR